MIQTFPLRVDSVNAQERADRRNLMLGYGIVITVGLVMGLARFGAFPDRSGLALAVLVCSATAIVARPSAGIYLVVFFAVLGDKLTNLAYPYLANFSSRESVLYINDALTFTPIEVLLVVTALSWLARVAGARAWSRVGRPLMWPVLLFGVMIAVGLVYGLVFRGGFITVAVWEVRPLLYLVGMYVLVSNLFTRTSQYVTLAWVAVLAISIQNLLAIRYYLHVPPGFREDMETLTEHPASLLYAWMFLLTLSVCLFRGSVWARALLVLAVIPGAYVFVLSERRAAFVALAAGFVVVSMVLFFRRRKAFFVVVPVVLLLTTGYCAAFWNSDDGIAFGARAVKSVIASDDLSERDASSDAYREIENYNLTFTIRAEPVMGVGFGKAFYRPRVLPDISFFAFYEYIPHNSVLWIWLNMGYIGFVTLLFLIAATIRAGTRASLRLPSGDELGVTVAALAFIVMFSVFAFVDIVWDARCCLFLAVSIATCANMLRLSGAARQRDCEVVNSPVASTVSGTQSFKREGRPQSWGSRTATRAPARSSRPHPAPL